MLSRPEKFGYDEESLCVDPEETHTCFCCLETTAPPEDWAFCLRGEFSFWLKLMTVSGHRLIVIDKFCGMARRPARQRIQPESGYTTFVWLRTANRLRCSYYSWILTGTYTVITTRKVSPDYKCDGSLRPGLGIGCVCKTRPIQSTTQQKPILGPANHNTGVLMASIPHFQHIEGRISQLLVDLILQGRKHSGMCGR